MIKDVNRALLIAGTLSILAAILHIAVIFGGPDWYRFFGAGEEMAQMAEQGQLYPIIVTLFIVGILTTWGLYAYSGAKYIRRLPFLRLCLVLITVVYCIRGVYGFFVPVFFDHPYVQDLGPAFWVWSSTICLLIGLTHLFGVRQSWQYLTQRSDKHMDNTR
jgi:membrane-bound acyltransferase YfiQ involved in biofilm formation